MGFENNKPIESAQARKRQEFIGHVEAQMRHVFGSHQNGRERIDDIKSRFKTLEEMVDRPLAEVFADLDACESIDDEDTFVSRMMAIWQPVLNFKFGKPEEFDRIARKIFWEREGHVKINDLLGYSLHNDGAELSLHIAPNEATSLKDLLKMMREGLRQLAKKVDSDPNIEKIVGDSWIVADHPSLVEKLGFTVGDIDKSTTIDRRGVGFAEMSREDFLAKYL